MRDRCSQDSARLNEIEQVGEYCSNGRFRQMNQGGRCPDGVYTPAMQRKPAHIGLNQREDGKTPPGKG